MKVEEIYLAFSNNQKFEFALTDDINSLLKKAFDLYDVQSPLIKAQTSVKSSIDVYNEAIKLSEKGLGLAKEIGDSGIISLMTKKLADSKGGIAMANRLYNTIDKAISEV